MNADRKFIKLKYRIAWHIGAAISFLFYFSGIMALYSCLRRRWLKRHIVVVLMYHRVGDAGEDPDITVSTKNFESQIKYLQGNFNIVSLDEIVNKYRHNTQLEKDTVAITFDDGYKDNYTSAYPILRKYNIPAAIFVATGFTGQDDRLSKDEIQVMQKCNITFGAHSVTHRVLSDLDRLTAFLEISDSKMALEKILKEKVKYFAYPYGKKERDFTDESVQMVKKAGFSAAFSTDNGLIKSGNDVFALNRIGMRNFPLFVFKGRLSGIFENKLLYILRRFIRV